jgi:hypothetical protein
MILDFFSERSIKRFFFIVVCIIALFWQQIIAVCEPVSVNAIISADKFLYTVASTNIYLSGAIKLLLFLACSYGFIVVLSVNNVLIKRKYLAVLLLWAVVNVSINSQNIVNILCALLCQLFALYSIFRIYHSGRIRSSAFIAAFFVGISSMFSFPFIMSVISILICLWIFYMVRWRDIIAVVLGLITPFVLLLYFFQIAYHDINAMWQLIKNGFAESIAVSFNSFDFIATSFLGFIFLTGLFSILKITTMKCNKSVYRMTDQLFYFEFFTSAIMFAVLQGMQLYAGTVFALSSAYLIARFSQTVKRTWLIEFIVFAIFIFSIFFLFIKNYC